MNKPKEAGLILAIDQASNAAGVSLWEDGNLKATTVLLSASPKDPFGKRLVTQVKQLTAFLDHEIGDRKLNVLLFEGVKSSMVLSTVGAFVTCPHLQNCKFTPKNSFISALSWKKYARDRGATQKFKEIKGVRALREIGFPVDAHNITSDDIADSCLIYLCWRSRA